MYFDVSGLVGKSINKRSNCKMKFLFVTGFPDFLINFRGELIYALIRLGMQIHVAGPCLEQDQPIRKELEGKGLIVHNIPMVRTGTNPVTDLRTLVSLCFVMRSVQPNIVLGYTIKPVIYGALSAWISGVPQRFALITGLGYAFQGDGKRGLLQVLVQWLYGLALAKSHKVFFQNPDDLALFRQRGLLNNNTPACVVNGSGVNVKSFALQEIPNGPPHFLMIARLLGDKGVREFIAAAKNVLALYPHAKFSLAGWIDQNPDAIHQHELDEWIGSGVVNYLGRLMDVRPAIAACTVYVLPSYREGTPRTVLEAMAMGRAIITTDTPGCRETVVNNYNGILVAVKQIDALTAAMCRFVDEPDLASVMGANSRRLAEEKYDVHKVNAVMLREMGIS